MQNPILIVMAAGIAVYFWLTLVASPIARAAAQTVRSFRGGGWAASWSMALGSVQLVTVISAAAVVLIVLAAPVASQIVLDGPELLLGVKIGGVLWAARAAAFGVPRVSPERELALALAAAALRSPDPAGLAALERHYRRQILPVEPTPEYSNDRLRVA